MKAIRDGNLMKEKSITFVINYLKWIFINLQVVDLVEFTSIINNFVVSEICSNYVNYPH